MLRIGRTVGRATTLLGVLWVAASGASAQVADNHPGTSVYKNSGCLTCHKWHGMGGPGYGGTPISLRETILTEDQLVEVIACGRPATGMPYHVKQAYDSYDCYGGLTGDDLGADLPGLSRFVLRDYQVRNVANFIVEQFKDRDGIRTQHDCQIFFGTSKMCDPEQIHQEGGGGGGH